MRRIGCFLFALFFAVIFSTGAAFSQQSGPVSGLFNRSAPPPDTNDIPVLATLVKGGAKLFYLGERSGIYGWFVMKEGQIQIIYATADKKTTLVGGMFTSDGGNVTGEQIVALSAANKEIAELINSSAKQQGDIEKAGGNQTAKGSGEGLPAVTISPGERLMQDLQGAASAVVGHNENAEILMVFSPNCPHCKSTWRELRESVAANRIQVRLIPITANLEGDDARAGAQLLSLANPMETWDKYVEGDKNALAGTPDSALVRAVIDNRKLLDRWNIRATPYLVYRAKDGRVKVVQGEPRKMGAVLADLLK